MEDPYKKIHDTLTFTIRAEIQEILNRYSNSEEMSILAESYIGECLFDNFIQYSLICQIPYDILIKLIILKLDKDSYEKILKETEEEIKKIMGNK